MSSAPSIPFPDFDRPPVAEVVLAVAFEPIVSLTTPELMRFAFSMEDRFPAIEEQPPLQIPLEEFGPPGAASGPGVTMVQGAIPLRVWLRNEHGTQLVQVQRDFFAANWQDAGGSEPYPRYPAVQDLFEEVYRRFESFLRERKLGAVAPTQCEVTYVNHIAPGTVWTKHGETHRILRLAGRSGEAVLRDPDSISLNYTYVIPDSSGLPRGRLHVIAQTGFRTSDNVPVVALNMTARALPLSDDEGGILECLQVGHEWVVKGFVDITTQEAHREWGLHE